MSEISPRHFRNKLAKKRRLSFCCFNCSIRTVDYYVIDEICFLCHKCVTNPDVLKSLAFSK
jgi:hypothetical protein